MYQEAEFQVSDAISLHFQVTNIFLQMCHCVLFVELTWNGEDAQSSYASRYIPSSTTTSHCAIHVSYRVKKAYQHVLSVRMT